MNFIKIYMIYNGRYSLDDEGNLIYFERETGKFAYWKYENPHNERVLVIGRCSDPLIGKVEIDGEVVYKRESKQ